MTQCRNNTRAANRLTVVTTEKQVVQQCEGHASVCVCVDSVGGTHIPCADMQCDSGCVLTIIRIHERQRSLPLPIHPALGETKDSAAGDRGETAGAG